VHAEASLASVFVSNLSSARSIPDAINAYQDWSSRRFEMMAEDGLRVLDETQKFMLTGERILRDGFVPKFQNVLP
jgi:hypothetical protein